jgi:hypothetical protein
MAGKSKKLVGFILGLFLGLLGLIIGALMYPSGSYERSTFVKGWIACLVLEILVIVALIILGNMGILSL